MQRGDRRLGVMVCAKCNERRRLLTDAIMQAKFADALKHAAKGAIEIGTGRSFADTQGGYKGRK